MGTHSSESAGAFDECFGLSPLFWMHCRSWVRASRLLAQRLLVRSHLARSSKLAGHMLTGL